MPSTDCAYNGLARRLFRFAVGLALLALAVLFFASGYAPPGPAGEVLRHNQANDIDASPLFYTEVEHMSALEDSLTAHLHHR
jgi:hypothetical protein